MSWKPTFDEGVACFKRGQLYEALAHMNQAAELENNAFIIYDSRAAVHEKLENIKAALLDSKRVIDLAPDRWQGYVRSARLFQLVGKHGSAVKMVDHALTRLRPEDVQRRAQLEELREKAITAQAITEAQRQLEVTETLYLLGKLPVETLVGIFTVLIDEDYTWAVKLSHVCGHWRRILINTPSAWQTLVLSKKHPVQKARLWKERAKNRISHVCVSLSPLDRATVFAQLLNLSWSDLSSLRISGEAFAELHRMLSSISLPHAFSNLDELTLLDFKSSDQLSCCLSGPNWKLSVLRLNGVIDMMDEWWERIQRLKELHLTGDVHRFSPLVFTTNPLLEVLVLDLPTTYIPYTDDVAPISMDNLKVVVYRDAQHPLGVLRAITAPSIRCFCMSHIPFFPDRALFHMACRSSLVELRITSCSLSTQTLPTLLPSTPNLEILQIYNLYDVVNEVFQFLTPNAADPPPCRALKCVDVTECSDLSTSRLYAFVKARIRCASEPDGSAGKCAVIASLTVDRCPNIEPDMLPWFRSKVAQFSCVYATKKDFKKNRR